MASKPSDINDPALRAGHFELGIACFCTRRSIILYDYLAVDLGVVCEKS